MKVTRLDPERGVTSLLSQLGDRLRNLETNPAGNVHIRERITTGDGVETVFGQLPDGSNGLQEFINDIIPPNKPSPPTTLEPTIGGIILTWDGLDYMGSVQPKDYSHTEVEYSDNGGSTWFIGATLTVTASNTTIAGLISGKEYSFRLRSFDQNLNASEYSAIVGGAKVVELMDPTGLIDDLREEHGVAIDVLERSLNKNTQDQNTLRDTITNLREVTIPNVERTIEDAQASIISTENALALIPGDIAAAKQAAVDAANSAASAAIALAQSSGQSLVKNGTFEAGAEGWTTTAGVTYIAGAARSGTQGMRVAPSTANTSPANSNEIQTSTGRTYYMEMWVKRTGTDTTTTSAIGFAPTQKTTAGVASTPIVYAVATENVALKTGDISTTAFTKVSAEFTITTENINRIKFAPWFKGPSSNVYFVDDILVVDITDSKKALEKAVELASADASTKASAAERAAIEAAARTAELKAQTAKTDAINAAAITAQKKADDAASAAEKAAKDYALLEATGAGATALASAKTDATNKANEAQRAAIEAAAITAQQKATQAKNDAITAAASTATEKANAAKADAIAAAAIDATFKADTALRNATVLSDAAQTAADKAIADALAAANLAGTKGKVLAQSTAPGAADRNAFTLWIDTSGTPALNTPKRWTTGTTWVAVTDKTAVDAAAAAAKAISDAAAAASKATTAESAADNAMQAAGSKTRVYYSTANPSGIASIGDTWRKMDSNGDIIGEWRYAGGTTPWVAQLVTSAMISNVDIGKLTVGTAVMTTAVADEFFAKIFSTNKLFAENIIIGEAGNSFPDPFFKDTEGWKPRNILPTGGRNGNPAVEIPAAAAQTGSYYGGLDRNRQFPVVGGSTYRMTVWVKADAATPANGVAVYAKWTNPTTAVGGVFGTPSAISAPALVANVWTPLTGTFEFPQDATKAMIGFYTQANTNVRVLFSEPTVVRLIEDALVVEGGIKARSIEASGDLSAKVAKFLEVSTDMLVAGTASITDGVADRFYTSIFSSRKIYTNQIVIGHPGNLLPDPGFNDAEFISRMNAASTCTVTKSGTNLRLLNSTTANTYFRPLGIKQDTVNYKDWIAVEPGEIWSFSASFDAFVGTGSMKFVGRSKDGTAYKNPGGATTIVAGDGDYEYRGTIPADCYWICPEVTVPPGTSYVFANSMVVRQVITPALVVDGLVSGQNIIGAIIQSNGAANRGIKITDDGLVAYSNTGVETLRFDGVNSMITGATIRTAATGSRVQMSTAGGLEIWTATKKVLSANSAGLEMDGTIVTKGTTYNGGRVLNIRVGLAPTNVNGGSATYDSPGVVFERPGISDIPATGYPKNFPAGISGDYSGDGLEMFAAAPFGYNATKILLTGPSMFLRTGASSVDPSIGGVVEIGTNGYPWTREMTLHSRIINIGQKGIADGAGETAYNTDLNLFGTVYFNGRSQAYIPSTTATMLNGFAHLNSSGWSGVRYTVSGDVVEVTGAYTRSAAYSSGSIIGSIPAAYRPAAKKKGIGADITTAGEIEITVSGSGANSFAVTYVR